MLHFKCLTFLIVDYFSPANKPIDLVIKQVKNRIRLDGFRDILYAGETVHHQADPEFFCAALIDKGGAHR